MNRKVKIIFWASIILGLIIRLLTLPYNGIFDMAVYHEWGLNTLKSGLNDAFQGTYLPFQYQIFEVGAYLTIKLKTEYFIVFKLVNLLFDIGNLVVLYIILRKINISVYYVLLYWLHPWFLLIFSQGYCDIQFTFFILCSILFSLKSTSRNYLIAGIFLGFAFLMKPQIQVIILALIIYGIYVYFKKREIKPLNLFIFPTILFINYSLYFFVVSGNPFRLLRTYVDIGDSLPLTANFLNGWFPVAYFLKEPGDAIYIVGDDLTLLGIKLRTYAVFSLLLLLYSYIKKIYKNDSNSFFNYNYLLIVTFSTFIFPFVMTSAHENHLFLATVLLIPVLGKVKNIAVKLSIHILLIIQFINMYGFYGYGESKMFDMISFTYTYDIAFILSLISFCAFLVLLIYFLKPVSEYFPSMKQDRINE